MTETGSESPHRAAGPDESAPPPAPVPAQISAEPAADPARVEAELRRREADLRENTLEFERESAARKHALALRIVSWGGGFAALVAAVCLAFAFVGPEPQSAYAKELLRSLGIALAGGGVIQMIVQALRWLFAR